MRKPSERELPSIESSNSEHKSVLRKLLVSLLRPFKTKIMLSQVRREAHSLQRNTVYIGKPKHWADLDKNGQHTVILLTIGGKTTKGYVVVRSGKTMFIVKNTPEAYCKVGATF